jgi:RecA-family ATPase
MSNYTPNPNGPTPFWQQISHHPIFCAFDVKPRAGDPSKVDKHPKAMDGMTGIKENASIDKLGTYEQAKALGFPFVGLSFTRPFTIIGKYLVCIDIDWKNAPDGLAHPKQMELMNELSGHSYETSHSGHGAHYWVLCEKDQIPNSVKLSPFHEIEIFASVKPGKAMNVLITDYDVTGELKNNYLKETFEKLAMVPYRDPIEPKVPREIEYQADASVIEKAIAYIPAEDYEIWIKVGMALKQELGDDGFNLWDKWSQSSDKYDPVMMPFKWGSFQGQGITAGTLIALAREHGYTSYEKSSALEDFSVDPETGEIIRPPSLLEKAFLPIDQVLTPTEWIIDGILPNGVGVISGVGGVGKTTALMPLAAIVAGFDDHLSDIKCSIPRKVLYITEDGVQANKAVYAIKKFRKSSNDIQTIGERLHLYHSNRYKVEALYLLLMEAVEKHSVEYRGVIFPPLVIFDTASANIDVDNENDNAEIGKFMTLFKQVWAKYKMPIWLINHLSKEANGKGIDEIGSLSARGASAWKDNGSWTANLAINQDSEDRILQIQKVREEVQFKEILFQSVVHSEFVTDMFGDTVEVQYRYCSAERSDRNERISKAMQKTRDELQDKIMEVLPTLEYPSGNDVLEIVGGKKTIFIEAIQELIDAGKIKKEPLPTHLVHGAKKHFLLVLP